MEDEDEDEHGCFHVIPVGDIREHDTSGPYCPCMPLISPNGKCMHNAYDKREVGEVGRLALYTLGAALADHEHTWTDEERWCFEHLDHILSMHWPAKASEERQPRPFD